VNGYRALGDFHSIHESGLISGIKILSIVPLPVDQYRDGARVIGFDTP